MPSYWGVFYPTLWDWAALAGTIGLFLTLFFLFLRFAPIVSIAEMREVVEREKSK
jgi:molybdopterin-containing oxidoreductase family membrane subunit